MCIKCHILNYSSTMFGDAPFTLEARMAYAFALVKPCCTTALHVGEVAQAEAWPHTCARIPSEWPNRSARSKSLLRAPRLAQTTSGPILQQAHQGRQREKHSCPLWNFSLIDLNFAEGVRFYAISCVLTQLTTFYAYIGI
jgi:hypothetical protein